MTKFKDELRKYPWPRSSAIRAHGKRWLEDDRGEDVWRKVSCAMGPEFSTSDFIKVVIKARSRADGLPEFLASDSKGRPTAEELKQIIKRSLSSKKSLSDIADLLENAAFSIRTREQLFETYLEGLPSNVRSRKTDPSAQALRAFCMIMSAFFYERCGSWLDKEVATLADIALDRCDTDVESVRQFRDGIRQNG